MRASAPHKLACAWRGRHNEYARTTTATPCERTVKECTNNDAVRRSGHLCLLCALHRVRELRYRAVHPAITVPLAQCSHHAVLVCLACCSRHGWSGSVLASCEWWGVNWSELK